MSFSLNLHNPSKNLYTENENCVFIDNKYRRVSVVSLESVC